MKTFGIAYFSTLVLFLAIDAIWLGVVARNSTKSNSAI